MKWNDFQDVLKASVGELRYETDFTDVTLACEDQSVKAHRVILSASSPFFKRLLSSHPQALVYLRGIKASEMAALVDFIYQGEAKILQEELESFLALAGEFELKGLSGYSEKVASELAKYPSTHEELSQNLRRTNVIKELPKFLPPFSSQEQQQAHVSRDKSRNGGLTSKAEFHSAVIPMQPKTRQSVRINPDTMAKVESMIEKGSDGYSCTQCDYTTRSKQHMKEHVEKHIEGLKYPCNSCPKVYRYSHSFRDHKRTCVI